MKNKLNLSFISFLLTLLVIFCLSSCQGKKTDNFPITTPSTTQSQTQDSQGASTGNTDTGNSQTGNSQIGDVGDVGDAGDVDEKSQTVDLMSGYTSGTLSTNPINEAFVSNQWRLALELFKGSNNESAEGNVLISPLSIQLALAMTANGADGETKSQMERLLGNDLTITELNAYLKSYVDSLPSGEKYKLSVANSIWFRNYCFIPNEHFLQTNKDYYDASIYSAPFDSSTVEDINSWVDKNTDGMIKELIEQIDNNSLMYLINAIAFDAEWEEKYSEYSITEGIFTCEDGTKQEVELMSSTEYAYYELENAKGFRKDYKNGKYSFVALLPNEGISVNELVDSLSYEEMIDMLNNPNYSRDIIAKMPKFSYEYSLEMNDVLSLLGMERAFNEFLPFFI